MRLRLIGTMFAVMTAVVHLGCDGVPPEIVADVPQVFYTFTSGLESNGGDGFDWPSEGSGLLVDDFPSVPFTTPDGVEFRNDIGNNLFFDDNYLLPNDAVTSNGIKGEALWGNPRPTRNRTDPEPGEVRVAETVLIRFSQPVARVAFDFAWVDGPNSVTLAIGDAPGGEFVTFPLNNKFNGGAVFQNADGFSGRIEFSVESLFVNEGLTLNGITNVDIFLGEISMLSGSTAFAVDNLSTRITDDDAG